MKIWCQMVVSACDQRYLDRIVACLKTSQRGDTRIQIAFPSKSIAGEQFVYRYFNFLNDRQIMEGMQRGQEEGFDAVIINCFYDPCLLEAREVMKIPVLGPAESSMMMASMMGKRFAIITLHPKAESIIEDKIKLYGMSARAIDHRPVRALTLSLEEQNKALDDPGPLKRNLEEISRGCIHDGAEVLIVGCTRLSVILQTSDLYEVEGVPVLECLTAALKIAEVFVDFKRAGLAWISRKGMYAPPGDDLMIDVKKKFSF